MFKIELTQVEATILNQLLESDLSDLRTQIIAADNINFKEMLRQRKMIIVRLLAILKEKQELPLAE